MSDNSIKGDEPGEHSLKRGRRLAGDLLNMLRFFSRLPIPVFAFEPEPHGRPAFSRAAPLVPLAGALLHAIGALILLIALWLRLSPAIAALLAIAALTLSTGAFHEDGLADSADGIGGGRTREAKLLIMRDSRIGTFGAAALFFALTLRAALLLSLVTISDIFIAALALIASGALTRVAALWLAVSLSPAQSDGAAFAAGAPHRGSFFAALAIAGLISGALIVPSIGFTGFVAGITACAVIAWGSAKMADHYLGGQTGDVAGACQQLSEIAFLTALNAVIAWNMP